MHPLEYYLYKTGEEFESLDAFHHRILERIDNADFPFEEGFAACVLAFECPALPSKASRNAGQIRTSINLSLRFAIFARDGFLCRYCGQGVGDGIKLEIDHILPHVQGGLGNQANLITACNQCNRGKRAKLLLAKHGQVPSYLALSQPFVDKGSRG